MASQPVLLIAVPAAVLGAASLGLGSAVQHRTAVRVPRARPLDPRLLLRLVRSPMWLLGLLAVLLGLSLQLVALAFGPLILVQPLLATSILFAAVFAAWLMRRQADRSVVLGCVLCVTGLAAFLLLARPRAGGVTMVGGTAPWALTAALAAVITASLLLAIRSAGSTRTVALAVTTGVTFGVNAGLMKLATRQFRDGGMAEMASHWAVYAVCVVGPAGFLLAQNTFQTGSAFAPALAVIRSVDPVVAVAIGVVWLGERVSTGASLLTGEVIAAVVLLSGIALLSRRTSRHPPEPARIRLA